mgnify:CR=1 FL=1
MTMPTWPKEFEREVARLLSDVAPDAMRTSCKALSLDDLVDEAERIVVMTVGEWARVHGSP